MNEMLSASESLVVLGVCLVVVALGLAVGFGYFAGRHDERREHDSKSK